jgi:hypothetical protein
MVLAYRDKKVVGVLCVFVPLHRHTQLQVIGGSDQTTMNS